MVPPFDIFKVERNGQLRWLEAVQDLEIAKARVKTIGTSSPGDYVIYSQVTGNKWAFSVKVGGAESPPVESEAER